MIEALARSALAARLVGGAIVVWLLASAFVEGFPELDTGLRQAMGARWVDALAAAGVFSLLWWSLRRRGAGLSPFGATAAVLALIALLLNGPAPLAALALLVVLAACVGHGFRAGVRSPAVRLVLGLGIVAGLVGWLLPLPIFHPAAAAAVAALAFWFGRARLRAEWSAWIVDAAADDEGPQDATGAWLWGLAVTLGSFPAWLPLRNPDDLSFRVGLGYELLEYAHARFDVGTQVWALSPWTSDVLHALLTLLAEGEASGPLSALWVLLAAWLVRGLALRVGASAPAAWIAGALYASLPITAFLAGGLQTEAMSAVVLAALATVLLQDAERPSRVALLAVALLAGMLMGIKVSNALLLLPMGVWMLLRWSRSMPWATVPIAGLGAIVVGGSSYAYAWMLTGNPALPVFNGVFQSPWFPPSNFVDVTWQTGFPWTLPWRMTVDAGRYFEGVTGVAGLSPLLALALVPLAIRDPRVRGLALAGLAGYILVLSQVQYLRYFHPALVLILPALMAALPGGRATRLAGTGVVLVQLALLPTASWMFMQGILRDRVLVGEDDVIARFAPEKLLAADFRAIAGPADRVLMTDALSGFVALLPGRAVGANWHNPRIDALRLQDMASPATWERIVREVGASHVIVPQDGIPAGVAGLLASRGATVVSKRGHMQLMALRPLEHPVDVNRVDDGSRVTFSAKLPAGHAWAASLEIKVTCSTPGSPIATVWTLRKGDAVVAQRWEWVGCPADGQMGVTRDLLIPAESVDAVFVDLSPAMPASGMVLEQPQGRFDLRRDLLEQTDLADAILPDGCRRLACRRSGALILDRHVQRGPSP
ncbi:MAG: hypothetical protein ACK4XJ_12335 [Fimbriimonadaceae bacterium]